MELLPVTIFADFTCPFSYVTEASFRGPVTDEIETKFRAFELFPDDTELAAPESEGDEWQTIERLAAFHDLPLNPPDRRFRTRKAHELSKFARPEGAEFAMRDAIYLAYWRDGADIGRIDVLSRLAGEVGLDADSARIALDIDTFSAEVDGDAEVARRLHIPGTPTLFFGSGQRARILAGAHGPAVVRTMIDEVSQEWSQQETDV